MELLKWVIVLDIVTMAVVDCLIAVRIHRTRKWLHPAIEYIFHLIVFAEGVLATALIYKAEDMGYLREFRWVEVLGFLLVPLIILNYSLVELNREYIHRTTNIAASSVGEASSKIDCGLLFVDKGGTPVLTNKRIVEMSEEIFGKNLTSSRKFWSMLENPGPELSCRKIEFTNNTTFITKEGRVYSFTRNPIEGKDRHYFEIVARDVTVLYEKSQELKKRNEELEEVESRLSEIYKNVANLKQEEELFAYKLKIHDELGNAILRGSKLLEEEQFDEREVGVLVEHWESLLNRLKSNSVSASSIGINYLEDIKKTAKTLGAEVVIKGQYPSNSEIAAMAVREALYNAVRHGRADRVEVYSERVGDEYIISISNNGERPKEPISEGGGISGLRKNLENAGGTLTVINSNGIKYRITLPVEE